jgi:hypothetical protein
MGWGTYWGWRSAVHSKKTARNTKIIAAEITRPRREAEAAAKAERKQGRKAARKARTDEFVANGGWAGMFGRAPAPEPEFTQEEYEAELAQIVAEEGEETDDDA